MAGSPPLSRLGGSIEGRVRPSWSPCSNDYPIRARKAADYAIWREAVLFWVAQPKGSRWHGPRDLSQIVAYKAAIEDARAYR